jgi:hypothetical protein
MRWPTLRRIRNEISIYFCPPGDVQGRPYVLIAQGPTALVIMPGVNGLKAAVAVKTGSLKTRYVFFMQPATAYTAHQNQPGSY